MSTPLNLNLPRLDELRGELRRTLGKALRDGAGGRLGSGQAEEAADRVIVGQGLPEEVRSLYGDQPICQLLCFDADSIHSWVFASERIQVSAGASFTLERLNQEVEEILQRVPGIAGKLYSAGGSGMVFASAAVDPDTLVEEARAALEGHNEPKEHGLTFTVFAEPLRAADLEAVEETTPLEPGGAAALHRFELVRGLQSALVRAQVRMQAIKDSRPRYRPAPPLVLQDGGPAARCPSCGRQPPSGPVEDHPRSWCQRCQALRKSFQEIKGDQFQIGDRSLTFEDLAGAAMRSRQYLAFLALDGNSMGNVVRGVRTFLELRAFSEATSRIYAAARDRVPEILRPHLEIGKEPEQAYLSLLSGGDEVTLVLSAAFAPAVALKILRAVERGFDHATAPGQLLGEAFAGAPETLRQLQHAGAGAGLVLASAKYPVRWLRRYADQLQQQAKRYAAGRALRSGLAWAFLTDSSPLTDELEWAGGALTPEALEGLLRETRAAIDLKVPTSSLQGVLAQVRREERYLGPILQGSAQREALGCLGANFFTYQLARSRELAAWWDSVKAPGEPPDAAARQWFQAHGARRLSRLLDLLSLDPIPLPSEVTP